MAGVSSINRYHEVWDSKEAITELFQWCNADRPSTNTYYCKEWLFALSTDQIQTLDIFMKHPNVKQVDVFVNKAHGPNNIHLVRYSLNKDFKSV